MKQIKVGAISYAQLIKHMLEGTYSCKELAEITGLHYVTVLQYTREMHAAKACHISSWDKDARGCDSIRVYKLGKGVDAKRQIKSASQTKAEYRARQAQIRLMKALAGQGAAQCP